MTGTGNKNKNMREQRMFTNVPDTGSRAGMLRENLSLLRFVLNFPLQLEQVRRNKLKTTRISCRVKAGVMGVEGMICLFV